MTDGSCIFLKSRFWGIIMKLEIYLCISRTRCNQSPIRRPLGWVYTISMSIGKIAYWFIRPRIPNYHALVLTTWAKCHGMGVKIHQPDTHSVLVQAIDERGCSCVPDSNSLVPRSGGEKQSVCQKTAPQHPTSVFSERGNVFTDRPTKQ